MLWTVDVNSDIILKMEYMLLLNLVELKGWRADIITGYFPSIPSLLWLIQKFQQFPVLNI